MRSPLAVLALAVLCAGRLPAQDQPPPNGPRAVDPGWSALTGARVITAPGKVLERATIVIRDGRITAVDEGGAAPPGARVFDCSGLVIHAAFVDAHVAVDAPAPAAESPDAHWHPRVTPQRSALDGAGLDEAVAKELRALGFGAAAIYPSDGVFRGRGAVVGLATPETGAKRDVLAPDVGMAVALEQRRGDYPSSKMGAIALVRQTFADAQWAARQTPPRPASTALGALAAAHHVLFDVRDELDALRAGRVLAEFGRLDGAALLGSGTEFRRLQAIAALRLPILLPLAFPDAPDVSTVGAIEATDLRQMATWEQAPTNASRLAAAGVSIALTTSRLDKRAEFFAAVRKAIQYGLSPDAALAALTTVPARLLGVDDRLGTVRVGTLANLCVVDGEPFAADRKLREVWIGGRRHVVDAAPTMALAGTWDVTLAQAGVSIERFEIDADDALELVRGETKVKARRLHRGERQIDLTFAAKELGGDGIWTLSALVQGERMSGIGVAGDGTRFGWTARRTAAAAPTPPKAEDAATARAVRERPLPVPFGAFGRLSPATPRTVVVRGATIWTSGPAGTLTDATLVVADGKVAYVGPSADAPIPADAVVVDGSGLHVTPGLIDCHSHTGIDGGVNEGSQAVTAEVRIADVLDPDDVNWYRQLAGGVTAVNQLHGSANPIGGQNQVTKLRWGVVDPEAMKFAGSKPGIKFALGENVKRSRSDANTRYPNTRMGVETLIRDRFTAAREYGAAWSRAQRELPASLPRRDLELEALDEILRGKRLVHCHSYRQDEILMLCRIADEFGFRIGTFQHGLEGYKVAEAIREHAIGASIFSDWWAYKYEVVDAIPENAAIMTRVGVTVSLNSDSNELARRLNTEASKAVKYGGLDPADALRLVTRNPARQLAIDERVGTLEVGKDGDFVLWSGDPLSTFSRCVETWIEGTRYWSEDEDREARLAVERERARLVQVILADPGRKDGAKKSDGMDNKPGQCECEEVNR